MNTIQCLPIEIITEILEYLAVGDLLIASQVCQRWRCASAKLIAERVSVLLTDDITPAIEILSESIVPYKSWVFKEAFVNLKGSFSAFWDEIACQVESLMLLNVDIVETDLIQLLLQCKNLKELGLHGLTQLMMTGSLLSDPEDIFQLKESLKNVKALHLACSRYLTDAIFSRITCTLGPLTRLSLAGCQISYQNAIYKRFYPQNTTEVPSDNVFTFKHILNYIEKNNSTLKEISLGRTTIDSTSLQSLALINDLKLTSVHLMSCDQLTKAGIEQLCTYQKHIIDLDLSLSSRLTDYAVFAITTHLPNIQILRMRRCRGLTETGIKTIKELKHLRTLDISHLDNVSSESVEEALCLESRPTLKWLSLSSIPLLSQCVISLTEKAPNLEYLDLSMCVTGATDESLQEICKNLIHLKVLNLNGCIAISDIGLSGQSLIRCKDIPTVESVGEGLSMESLGLRKKNPYKIALGCKEEQKIREEAEVKKYLEENFEALEDSVVGIGLSNLTKLEELNLCGCSRITDITLIHGVSLPSLKNLNISHCQQVTDSGLITMAHNCTSLETLSLIECSHVTDQTLLGFSHHLKRLKTLDLQHCTKLTDDSLDSIGSCRSLVYLDVSGCVKMSLEQISILQKRLPRLQNLHYRGIRAKSVEGRMQEEMWESKKILPTPPPLLAKLKKKISF